MTAERRLTGSMKRLALAAGAVLLASCGNAAQSATPTAAPNGIVDSHGTFFPVIDNDGTYLVGVDIWAGKYRSPGGTTCNWARLSSSDTSDVIDSKNTDGPQVVTIRATDIRFLTRNCGTWQMIPGV
jgi:hypothetical protein